MMKPVRWLLAASTAFAANAANAHDFFLLPESFHSHSDAALTVRATVGSHFPTPEIAVTPDRDERLWAVGGGNPQVTIAGADDKSLLLGLSGAHGTTMVAVKSKARDVQYAEDRIPLILGEYRVAPAAAAAVNALPRPRNWQVVSRRFAKTIICAHDCSGGEVARKPLDGTLEFVASADGPGHFQLLQAGKPLANYPVDLVGPDGERTHLSTEASGAVRLPDGLKGPIMLFAAFLTAPMAKERFTLDLTSLTIQP